jgi:hypothetical protein
MIGWGTCASVFCLCLACIALGLVLDERRNRRNDIPASRIYDCKPGAFQTSALTKDWK